MTPTKHAKMKHYHTLYFHSDLPTNTDVNPDGMAIEADGLIECLQNAKEYTYPGFTNSGVYLFITHEPYDAEPTCKIEVECVETEEAYAERIKKWEEENKIEATRKAQEREKKEHEMYLKLKAKYEASALPKEESDG